MERQRYRNAIRGAGHGGYLVNAAPQSPAWRDWWAGCQREQLPFIALTIAGERATLVVDVRPIGDVALTRDGIAQLLTRMTRVTMDIERCWNHVRVVIDERPNSSVTRSALPEIGQVIELTGIPREVAHQFARCALAATAQPVNFRAQPPAA
jgi:hypothetical protein